MEECERQQNWAGISLISLVSLLSLVPGLGSASVLTYHEAFVVQGASEILTSGRWLAPTIGGLPWLEKPPLPFWSVAILGKLAGSITPGLARIPSVLAATILALGIGHLGARAYGQRIGTLAGCIQATTYWCVFRGRLAEADILLACLITLTVVAFDHLRAVAGSGRVVGRAPISPWCSYLWRCIFFSLLGLGALAKGISFGGVLILSMLVVAIVWDRDWLTLRCLLWPPGWVLAGLLALTWPVAVVARYGTGPVDLWVMHVSRRLAPESGHGPFAGETGLSYVLNVLGQGLPWTPLAIFGALIAGRECRRSLRLPTRPVDESATTSTAHNRLLWSWTLAPMALVSVAPTRNAHYAIYAMVPWSLWAAIGVTRLGSSLHQPACRSACLKWLTVGLFPTLAVTYGFGYCLAAVYVNHRSLETSFYEHIGASLRPGDHLALLYDAWDRDPYPTPFGQIPHDLALRLFYLRHPACWHFGLPSLANHLHKYTHASCGSATTSPITVIGRARDADELRSLGTVEASAHSLSRRWDRQYVAFHVWPRTPGATKELEAALGSMP